MKKTFEQELFDLGIGERAVKRLVKLRDRMVNQFEKDIKTSIRIGAGKKNYNDVDLEIHRKNQK